ncbi:unnamed protein product, partial [Sphacelaria rigidula]
YGNLSADPRLEHLWHVASCASGQAFSMDFEYRPSGVVGVEVDDRNVVSTVQVIECLSCLTVRPEQCFVRLRVER